MVKTTVYLRHIDDFAAMNAVYAEAFGDHRPARATVGVAGLPWGPWSRSTPGPSWAERGYPYFSTGPGVALAGAN